MEEAVRTALRQRLGEHTLWFKDPTSFEAMAPEIPTPLTMLHSHGAQQVTALLTSAPTLTRALQAQAEIQRERLFLLGPVVHPRSARDLRAAGIQFLDAAGNAYLNFDGVLIDVRGRKPDPRLAPYKRSSERSTNLFTPRRAQVIFVLLSWPALVDASVRTIAAAAMVSVGQAQSTLRLLDEQDLYDHRSGRLLRRDLLAERWAETYATGLGLKTRLKQFHGDPSRLVLEGHEEIYVSGEQAAPWIRNPGTATLYVDELDLRLALTNHWRTDGDPNIAVRKTFWAIPDGEEVGGFPVLAPPLLIYADLLATHESRQWEAAQKVKEDHAEIWDS